jgi:hypothetical protein
MSAPVTTAERLAALERIDERIVHSGRYVSVSFLLEVGREPFIVTIERGRVVSVVAGPFVMPQWTFALRASAEEWERFWQATPVPGSYDLFALLRREELQVEGDLHPFMSNLLYFKALLAAPRARAAA